MKSCYFSKRTQTGGILQTSLQMIFSEYCPKVDIQAIKVSLLYFREKIILSPTMSIHCLRLGGSGL